MDDQTLEKTLQPKRQRLKHPRKKKNGRTLKRQRQYRKKKNPQKQNKTFTKGIGYYTKVFIEEKKALKL